MDKLKPCPFCGGGFTIQICDAEGNFHNEIGYEDDPWSGLRYAIIHLNTKYEDCPIAHHEEEIMGSILYDNKEELIKAWNTRTDTPLPTFAEVNNKTAFRRYPSPDEMKQDFYNEFVKLLSKV